VVGMLLIVAGVIGSLIGGIWFLVVAFNESALWGLGCLFVPFVSLIFLIKYWDQAGKPFLVQLAAIVPLLAGAFLTGP
jgi:hypothetical protein